MSRLDEPVDAGAIAQSAHLTIDAHEEKRRCHLECPGSEDCRQYQWAVKMAPEYAHRPQPARR